MLRSTLGGARFGLLLLFVSLASCWDGGQAMYTSFSSGDMLRLTMAEYERAQPSDLWLELTDAYLAFFDSGHIYAEPDSLDPTDRIYVPVHGTAEAAELETTPQVVLETRDQRLVTLYNEMGTLSEQTIDGWLDENYEEVSAPRTIRGLVKFGFELEQDERRLLEELYGTSNLVILSEGATPSAGSGIFMILLGIGLAIWGLSQLAKGAEAVEPAEQPIRAGA